MGHRDAAWWQQGIIYQIYPRSFQDSNKDGIGDLNGIRSRLTYLKWLGITIIWISPIYPSPMADFGYDVSDYTGIHPAFGSMADFDALLQEVHALGMKLILDFVPNHTSGQHPWFLESRSSRQHPKRDWYIWRDARPDGAPPNNWLAAFGGSAWQWDEETGQYYYHAFLKEQPDLNWRNPEVREAMLQMMRFWLERGVDGFRVDVMWHLIKDEQLRDNPPNPAYQPHMPDVDRLQAVFSTDQPEVLGIVQQMRKLLDAYGALLIGEIYLPVEKLVRYYGPELDGAHLPYNFQLITLPWDAAVIADAISSYEAALPEGGWPNWVLGNHDQPRIASRVGPEQARVAAMLLLSLRGTPTIYYGDELGMRDVPIPPDEVQDPQGLNMPGKYLSRDPARTPMRWDDSPHGGFSAVRPWLRTGAGYDTVNVAAQQQAPDTMLDLYHRLIRFRQSEPALLYGAYQPLEGSHKLIAFIRALEHSRLLVVLNLSHGVCYFNMEAHGLEGRVAVATHAARAGMKAGGLLCLGGSEGLIIRLDSAAG